MAIKKYKPTSPGRRFMTTAGAGVVARRTSPHKPLVRKLNKSGGRDNRGRICGAPPRRRTQAALPHDRLQAGQDRDPGQGRDASSTIRTARADIALVCYADGERRYILAPERAGGRGRPCWPRPRRTSCRATRCRCRAIPLGHDAAQHRAAAGQGRADGPLRGHRRAVDRQGGRATHCCACPRARCARSWPSATPPSARSATWITRTRRIGKAGPQPLAGLAAHGPRRGDEPGGPPARRRRGPHLRRPPPGDALGRADQGQEDAQQPADRRITSCVAASRTGTGTMARSISKGPFVDDHLRKKVDEHEQEERHEGDQDLVAAVHGDAGHGQPHHRRAQRQEVHPGLRDREHGRAQAGRVRADADLQGAHGQGRQLVVALECGGSK